MKYVQKQKNRFENHPSQQPEILKKTKNPIEKQPKPEKVCDRFVNRMKIL